MSNYNLTGKYETLLSSLSNELTIKEGKRVSKTEVLERILDIVIEEERLFSIEEQPLSFFTRSVYYKEKEDMKPSSDIIRDIRAIVKKIS